MPEKSLLHSARVTVGNKMYIAGKRQKTYKIIKNIGVIKTAGKIKKVKINILRTKIKTNPLFWHTESKTNKHNSKNIKNSNNLSAQMASGIKDSFKNYADSQNDNSTANISALVKTGEIGVKSFKGYQTVSPVFVKTIKKTGKGIYKIGKTTVKIVNTIDKTSGKIILGTVKFDFYEIKNFRKLALDKVKQSNLIKSAVFKIQNAKETIVKAKNNILSVKKHTLNTVKLIGAVLDGTITVKFTKQQLKQSSIFVLKSTSKIAGKAVKSSFKAAKTTVKTAGKTAKTAKKVSSSVADVTVNTLTQSQDTGVQSLGYGIKTAQYAPKIVNTSVNITSKSVKGIKTAVKAPIKTAKTTVKTIKYVKANGFNGSVRKLGTKTVNFAVKSGRSVVSAIINLIKKASLKFLLPLILIAVVITMFMSALSAPIAVVLDMFGGIITFFFGDGSDPDNKVEVVVEEYIADETERGIKDFNDKLNETINKNLVKNGGGYHVVYIYFGENEEQISIDEIPEKISSSDELSKIIEPVFNTLVFQRYERKASEKQAKELIDEIYSKLFVTKIEPKPIEYCNSIHNCGFIHSSINCLNTDNGYHDSYYCLSCDSYAYSCNGHNSGHSFPGCVALSCAEEHTHTNSCYSLACTSDHTYYHTASEQAAMEENKQFICNGYLYCSGHFVLGIHIEQGNLDKLLDDYFLKPIAELETVGSRTEQQEEELKTLKTNYNLCYDYINIVDSRNNGE